MEELYRLLGEAVKRGRRDARMTQEALANRVGLTRTSITNIEKGKQNVSLHTVYDLAAALNKHPDDLLPSPDVLTADAIKRRKLEQIELAERNRELVGRLISHSEKLREELKK